MLELTLEAAVGVNLLSCSGADGVSSTCERRKKASLCFHSDKNMLLFRR